MNPKLAEITGRIRQILPGQVRSVQAYPNAEQYLVVEVDSEWIFKFVRDSDDPCIEYERQFLPLFAQMSPLPVPEICHFGQDYFAYRKISGERLTSTNLNSVSPASRARIAEQLGEFLTVLHSFPVNVAEGIGLSDSWGGWRERAHMVFKSEVTPLLSETTREGALSILDQYSGLHNRIVIHGDFAPFNILIDMASERIAGVIDFGHMTIEEDARDFVEIASSFETAFLSDVISNYETDAPGTLLSRVEVRQREALLGDAVYAFQTGQSTRLQRRVAEIESVFDVGRETKN